jgi:hypothetical protein
MNKALRLSLSAFVLCCGLAFAQQQPQWTVISSQKIVDQSTPIAPVTLFTPPKGVGLYRLTAYIAETGTPGSSWILKFNFTAATGTPEDPNVTVSNGDTPTGYATLGPFIFSPKPGVPITYEVDPAGGSEIPFTLMFAIESLQLPQAH